MTKCDDFVQCRLESIVAKEILAFVYVMKRMSDGDFLFLIFEKFWVCCIVFGILFDSFGDKNTVSFGIGGIGRIGYSDGLYKIGSF